MVRSGGSSADIARRLRVVSHGRDARPGGRNDDATGCSLVGPRAIEWTPRVPGVLGQHFRGATRGIKSSGWAAPSPARAASRHGSPRHAGSGMWRFRCGIADRHNRWDVPCGAAAVGVRQGASCDLMRRNGSGACQRRVRCRRTGQRMRHGGAAAMVRISAMWLVAWRASAGAAGSAFGEARDLKWHGDCLDNV